MARAGALLLTRGKQGGNGRSLERDLLEGKRPHAVRRGPRRVRWKRSARLVRYGGRLQGNTAQIGGPYRPIDGWVTGRTHRCGREGKRRPRLPSDTWAEVDDYGRAGLEPLVSNPTQVGQMCALSTNSDPPRRGSITPGRLRSSPRHRAEPLRAALDPAAGGDLPRRAPLLATGRTRSPGAVAAGGRLRN